MITIKLNLFWDKWKVVQMMEWRNTKQQTYATVTTHCTTCPYGLNLDYTHLRNTRWSNRQGSTLINKIKKIHKIRDENNPKQMSFLRKWFLVSL